jgi:hypothetical protein
MTRHFGFDSERRDQTAQYKPSQKVQVFQSCTILETYEKLIGLLCGKSICISTQHSNGEWGLIDTIVRSGERDHIAGQYTFRLVGPLEQVISRSVDGRIRPEALVTQNIDNASTKDPVTNQCPSPWQFKTVFTGTMIGQRTSQKGRDDASSKVKSNIRWRRINNVHLVRPPMGGWLHRSPQTEVIG